jgi:hypothetical protein
MGQLLISDIAMVEIQALDRRRRETPSFKTADPFRVTFALREIATKKQLLAHQKTSPNYGDELFAGNILLHSRRTCPRLK